MKAVNMDVRIAIMESGIKMWKIADCMGIHDSALSRLMRSELTVENREKILYAIKMLRRGTTDE